MRPYTLLGIVLIGALLAFAVHHFLGRAPAPAGTQLPDLTITGRPPAFHLDVTPTQARVLAERCFYAIASDRPERLGGTKDDLALLLDRDEIVEFILAEWHVRRNEGKYADAAFADIFTLVRNRKFVEPTRELLQSSEPLVATKAVEAAMTQRDPSLVGMLLPILARLQSENTAEIIARRVKLLQAAAACGGDGLVACVQLGLRDPASAVVVAAAGMIAAQKIDGLDADLRILMQSASDLHVRAQVAATLLQRGDLAARRIVIEGLDPRNPDVAAESAHLITKYRLMEAMDSLTRYATKTEGELRRVFELALVRLGDRTIRAQLMRSAESAGDPHELDSLQILAASGDPEVVPILERGVERGGSPRWRAIAAGIATGRDECMIPVIKKLVEQPIIYPADFGECAGVGGDAIVPRLAELLHAATEPTVQIRYITWLGESGMPSARDVLLKERSRIPRLVDERLRLIDLDRRRRGVT